MIESFNNYRLVDLTKLQIERKIVNLNKLHPL